MLGADTRATEGAIVCDKNCEKIHYIAPNIYCCGAGTSADTENSTSFEQPFLSCSFHPFFSPPPPFFLLSFLVDLISAQVKLLRLNAGRDTRVVTALTQLKRRLFRFSSSLFFFCVFFFDSLSPHHFLFKISRSYQCCFSFGGV